LQFEDTKSTSGTTLLHTLERIIATRFQHIEEFQKEIDKPVKAYKRTSLE
jgi:hypothetical protein